MSNAKRFDPEEGIYACIGAHQNRTWASDVAGAIDHAANLIAESSSTNDLLIIKVVGRVRRRVPVDFTSYEKD